MDTEKHLIEAINNMQCALSTDYPKDFQKWLDAPATLEFLRDFSDAAIQDPDVFVEKFQSQTQVELVDYSLEELLKSAYIQAQNSLVSGSIKNIFMNPKTGLAKTSLLLEFPVVTVMPNGELRLLSGNHRLACIFMMAVLGFMESNSLEEFPEFNDYKEILALKVRCLQRTFDRDSIGDVLSAGADDTGHPIPADDTDVTNYINQLAQVLWLAYNQSRSPKTTEIAKVKLYEKGVDIRDNESLLSSVFPESGKGALLSKKDGFAYIAMNYFNDNTELPEAVDEDGNPLYNVDEMERFIPSKHIKQCLLTKKSLFDIMSRFYYQLSGLHILKPKLDSNGNQKVDATGKPKVLKIKYWARDLSNPELFPEIAYACVIGSTPLISAAIDRVIDRLPTDSEYRYNLARNATEIASEMVTLYDNMYGDKIEDDPRREVPKQVKSPKTSKRKVSVYQGLSL